MQSLTQAPLLCVAPVVLWVRSWSLLKELSVRRRQVPGSRQYRSKLSLSADAHQPQNKRKENKRNFKGTVWDKGCLRQRLREWIVS